MKISLFFLLTLLIANCGFSPSAATDQRQLDQQVFPEFVDDPAFFGNMNIMASRQERIYERNYDAIVKILKYDPAIVRQEMHKRLAPNQPMSLQLLAAAVLVLEKDDEGRQFFLSHARITDHLGDLYVTFDHLVWSTESLTGSKAELSWAEDMLVEALQNRTQVKPQNAIDVPFRWSEPTIEIRALAIDYGGFANHLAMMHSEKGLPVILSLLREYPDYDLKTCIGYFGRYNDERVRSLLLEILNKHQDAEHADTYRFAVSAASEMGLKAAVPILLRHLDDQDSYAGLRALAEATVLPTIKGALPRLKSYARAEAEFTLVHSQGGDVVPGFLELLKRKDYLKRHDVIMRLEELHDPRSVPAMTTNLCSDSDWFIRFAAIRVLAAVRNREAIRGLVNGLGCDYSKLNRWKTNRDYDYNREYREEIAKALKAITGEDFGVDQNRWTLWLNQHTGT